MPQATADRSTVAHRAPIVVPLLLAVALAAVPPPVTAAEPLEHPAPTALLARALETSGGDAWRDVKTLRIVGDLEAHGLSGHQESLEDLREGRSVTSWELGSTTGASGFDGDRPWFRDASGDVTVTDSQGEMEAARNDAYRTARAWWFPERWPATVEYLRRDTADGRDQHGLLVSPEGGRPFELWLDVDSGRVSRIVEEGSIRTSTTVLSDYREVEGLWLPFRVVSSTGEPNSEVVTLVTDVVVDPEPADGAFDVPVSAVADFEMPAAATSVTLPFELLNNHIYVRASVNGSEPRRFLVDTGGVNLLTRRAAADLGVATEGSFPVGGVGEKTIQASFAQLDGFSLAGIDFPEPRFLVIPFEEVEQAEGVEMAGLVGFEVFRRFVVTIDYGAGMLTLTLPEAFETPADAVPVPFTFDGRHPVVDGAIDGIPGSFTIDTGSRSTLDLHGPFVHEHDLMAAYRPRLSALTGWGVGGGVRSHVARADMLMLGDVPVLDLPVELTAQEGGAFSDHYQAGNVGGGVLKRFTVTFHYPRQEILFQPGPLADRPDGFDRSGMWLNGLGDALRVEDVVTDGPAADAGIAVGDHVVAVDGVPVAEIGLPSLRQRLRSEPPGTEVVLTVSRDGERRRARLVLRDLLADPPSAARPGEG